MKRDEPPRSIAGALLLPLLCFAWPAAAQGTAPPLSFDVEHYDVEKLLAAAESGRPFELHFLGAVHTLRMEPAPIRSSRFSASALNRDGARTLHPAPTKTFKGIVDGDPESMVRLSFRRGGLSGYIRSASGWTFIEPLAPAGSEGHRKAQLDGLHRVFSEADLDPAFSGECMQLEARAAKPAGSEQAELLPLEPSSTSGQSGARTAERQSLPVLEVAIDADFEYFQLHGDGTSEEIESVLSSVAGIYERELGITLELVHLTVREEEEDPYTSTDSLTLLTEFRNHWNSTKTGIHRDVAHLFTGKDLDSSTVGIAYVAVVCTSANAYGLSQEIHSTALMPILVAHEIGHNLGALHDQAGTSPRYIMYPSLGFSNLDQFSSQSKSSIESLLENVSCVRVAEGEDGGGSSSAPGPAPPAASGGGPVHPLLIVVALAAAALHRRQGRKGLLA
jgi:hypothetical protein